MILMTNKKEYLVETPFDPQSRYDDLEKFEDKFWEKKSLDDMTKDEWELLCDGCGKCCLNKLEIRGKIKFTRTHCRFLNCESCLCEIYHNRFEKVSDCRDIDLDAVRETPAWLPKTCAYWLLDNGEKLPNWHPLITKKAKSVHDAEMSLRNRNTVSETGIQDYENYIIHWEDL